MEGLRYLLECRLSLTDHVFLFLVGRSDNAVMLLSSWDKFLRPGIELRFKLEWTECLISWRRQRLKTHRSYVSKSKRGL